MLKAWPLTPGLRTLFAVLHVSSLRCARLVLRTLRHLLPLRTLGDISASLLLPPQPADSSASSPVDVSDPDDERSRGASGGGGRASGMLSGILSRFAPGGSGGASTSGAADLAAPLRLSASSSLTAALPSEVAEIPALIAFFLTVVADQFIEAAPGTPLVLLSCRSLWRGSQVRCALASECLLLLRHLALCDGFQAPVRSSLRASLLLLPTIAACLRDDPSAAQLAETGLLAAAKLSLGALHVLGGSLPTLFVGCRVGVEAGAGAASSPDRPSAADKVRQEGMLVRWDGAEDSGAHVLLDSQLGELRLIPVSALQLLPLDDAELPLGTFALEPELTPCFAAFLPKAGLQKESLSSGLQGSLVFGLLQTRALKALQRLLTHPPSMRVALAGGLLPGIMASATTPIPLLGMHHTEVLQGRLAMLEQLRIEASTAARMAKDHGARAGARAGGESRREPDTWARGRPLRVPSQPLLQLELCRRLGGRQGGGRVRGRRRRA